MKTLLFLAALFSNFNALAEEAKIETKEEWRSTVLTEATIAKIQEAKYQYKKCVSDEMQKPEYQKQDSRFATDGVMRKCEVELAKMREVYLGENVPGAIADRHLKQLRTQVTRSALENLMFAEAARKSGQPDTKQ